MLACKKCGKPNPEGNLFCGSCGSPLSTQAGPTPAAGEGASPVTSRPSRPSSTGVSARKRIEWIAWSELTTGQKFGRVVAIALASAVVLVVVALVAKRLLPTALSSVRPHTAKVTLPPPTAKEKTEAVTLLCQVFAVNGMPADDAQAIAAANSAEELFGTKVSQSPQRVRFVLATVAHEFSAGKLGAGDCSEARQAASNNSTVGVTGKP